VTGSDYERAFARLLDEQEYHVIRAPSSGSATQRDLPDIAFSKAGETPIMVELKTTGQKAAYFTETEVNALERFATAFNGVSRLCARYKQDTRYYLYDPKDARRTPSNRYAVDRDIEPTQVIE
jgi:Holliday junction resolvase